MYEMTVLATSGTGDRIKTAEKTIIVTVTDVTEPPATPNAPSVSAVSHTSLRVTWSAPENKGPPIIGYDYQYKKTSASNQDWTEETTTGSPVTIGSLDEGTEYEVQIRAKKR